MPTIAENFDANWREDLATGCWIWLRARKGKEAAKGGGYGCLRIKGKCVAAHKFSYERKHGPVPAGLQLLHSCHNTLCVNPDHVRPGTNDDNAADRAAAGRYANKLTPAKVRQMRQRDTTYTSYEEIGDEFDVSSATARDIILGLTWKHVV